MNSYIGEQFGRWTLIGNSNKNGYVRCQCECGTIKDVWLGNLTNGRSKSCGCYKVEMQQSRKPSITDLTGCVFGEWTVLHRADNKNSQVMWHCRCSCGIKRDVNAGRLKDGQSKSCGHPINLVGHQIGYWRVLEQTQIKRPNGHMCTAYLCECVCGTQKIIPADTLKRGASKSCGCVLSKPQIEICNRLSDMGIKYECAKTFDDLRGSSKCLPFDFAIFDKGDLCGLIEYQGKQHYAFTSGNKFGKYQRDVSDGLKKQYCKDHGIPLFEITYTDNIEMSLYKIIETLHVNPVPRVS